GRGLVRIAKPIDDRDVVDPRGLVAADALRLPIRHDYRLLGVVGVGKPAVEIETKDLRQAIEVGTELREVLVVQHERLLVAQDRLWTSDLFDGVNPRASSRGQHLRLDAVEWDEPGVLVNDSDALTQLVDDIPAAIGEVAGN